MSKWGNKYNYKNVNLPTPILDEVDKVVAKNPYYTSRAEFVKCAIRDKLEKEKP